MATRALDFPPILKQPHYILSLLTLLPFYFARQLDAPTT
jgi:hypothetical protein